MSVIRPACPDDATGLAALIQPIIDAGGLTAFHGPLDADSFSGLFDAPDPRARVHVAEATGDRICAVQWIEPHPDLPPGIADIATFVDLTATRGGTGRALFAVTLAAAREAGWRRLNAVVRISNPRALAYYREMGFCTIRRERTRTILRRGLQPAR